MMTSQETMTTADEAIVSAVRAALSEQIGPARIVTEESEIVKPRVW